MVVPEWNPLAQLPTETCYFHAIDRPYKYYSFDHLFSSSVRCSVTKGDGSFTKDTLVGQHIHFMRFRNAGEIVFEFYLKRGNSVATSEVGVGSGILGNFFLRKIGKAKHISSAEKIYESEKKSH